MPRRYQQDTLGLYYWDTVLNGEDTGNDKEVHNVNNLTGDDSGIPTLNPGGDNFIPTPPPSSWNSSQ